MSNQPSHSERSLTIPVFNPNDVLLALLACLELAVDHPSRSRELSTVEQSDLLRFAHRLAQAIEQGESDE